MDIFSASPSSPNVGSDVPEIENKAIFADDLVRVDPLVRISELADRYRDGQIGPDGFAKEVCRVLDQG